jgi:hypothetical protein
MRRARARDPRSPWLKTIAEIVAYSGEDKETVNQALLTGELQGRQRGPGCVWRTKPEWVDAWIDSFGQRAG